jgi:hypothetical protein
MASDTIDSSQSSQHLSEPEHLTAQPLMHSAERIEFIRYCVEQRQGENENTLAARFINLEYATCSTARLGRLPTFYLLIDFFLFHFCLPFCIRFYFLFFSYYDWIIMF